MANYPVDGITNAELNDEILVLQNRVTALETDLALLTARVETNETNITKNTNDITTIKALIDTINSRLDDLEENKVDKRDGYDIVKVEDVETGDAANVANIDSIRRELDELRAMDRITGETTAIDLETCSLTPTPIDFATFALNKGTYLITGFIRYEGIEQARGEVYFEHDGIIKEESKVIFGGQQYDTVPVTTLLQIDDDNTTVSLKARRLTGTKLDLVSNNLAKSYLTWVKLDSN